MQIINSIAELRTHIINWHNTNECIALVPTMGNLHLGHATLINTAWQYAQRVVVSIFVNPLQFNANEDFASYPRTWEADKQLLERMNVNIAFVPNIDTLFPNGEHKQTRIVVPEIANILCGASRPGHFDGVTTIVCKLFNLVQPNVALFGAKDWQQLILIKRMTTDLNLPIEIISVPTVREPDGLAMSSRNSYLTPAQRSIAPNLYQSLQQAAIELKQGLAANIVEMQAKNRLIQFDLQPDYVSVRRAWDLANVTANDKDLIILAAARLGAARLIDNFRVEIY